MLNYILPPIIIIISVSILIVFLFRKTEELAVQRELIATGDSHEKKTARFVAISAHFSLKVLERLMHKLKLVSLKFHNLSNEWFQTIREKRQKRVQIERQAVENLQSNNVSPFVAPERLDANQNTSRPRPTLKQAITRPQPKMVQDRNQLEEVLIKRIAVNPKDIEAYERLGDYYLENENFQDSLECFKQVLRLSPLHHKARLRINRLEKMLK